MYDKGADGTVTWCLTESGDPSGKEAFAKARGRVEAFFAHAKQKFPKFQKPSSGKNPTQVAAEWKLALLLTHLNFLRQKDLCKQQKKTPPKNLVSIF